MKNPGINHDVQTLRKALQMDGIPGRVIAKVIYECFGQGYDPKKVAVVFNRLSEETRFRLLNPEPFPPIDLHEIPQGGLDLGDLANGRSFTSGVYPPVVLITGATGTGKTNYLNFLLRQF